MAIPRKIHFCWFGGAPKPDLVLRCIETWKQKLPNYELCEWNENTFDLGSHPFAAAMHKARKWAFLSDYVRMWAVYKYGGIYLDTDCEVHASLDFLLESSAFIGFERFFDSLQPFTACFGAVPSHPFIKKCVSYYDSFKSADSKDITNTLIVSAIVREKYGVKMKDVRQDLPGGLVIYPSYSLCTPNFWHKRYVTHHFDGSWTSRGKRSKPLHLRLAEKVFRWAPVCTHRLIVKAFGTARWCIGKLSGRPLS
jgi:mannosyltransferase OCH1-like enzyme